MWNPFRRAPKSDNERLRRVESALADLQDDLALVLKRSARIDARLREKASREARSAEPTEEVTPSSPSEVPSPQQHGQFSKEELRSFARSRGLLPH